MNLAVKIIAIVIALIVSIGLTLMIKPHIEVYIASQTTVDVLQIVFNIVGFVIAYQAILSQVKLFKKK